MANYQNLLNTINGAIQTNGTGAITGQLLQTVLDGMVASLGAKYQYAGVATPATNPGTPDENVFYLATQAGTYTNFGRLVVNDGEVCALKWYGAWAKDVTGAATAEQVSQLGQEIDEELGTIEHKLGTIDYKLINYLNENKIHQEDGDYGYWNTGGGGSFVKNNNYRATEDYVPVVGGTTYYAYQQNAQGQIVTMTFVSVCWYDESKNFISGQSYRDNYTAPINAKYARFNFAYGANVHYMVLETDEIPESFIPFMYHTVIEDGTIYPQDETPTKDSKKLVNSGAIYSFVNGAKSYAPYMKNGIDNGHIYPTNGYWNPYTSGALSENNNYRAIETYVPVVGGTTYYCWRCNTVNVIASTQYIMVCWYDKSKAFISGEEFATSHTAPSNASYMRLSYVFDNNYRYMITNTPTMPLEYIGYSVDKFLLDDGILVNENQIEGATKYITYNISNASEFISKMIEIMNKESDFPSELNRYILKLAAGTYDIDVSEVSGITDVGLIVMPYVSIIGAGREDTILQYNYDGLSDSIMVNASGLNCPFTCFIENLTVEVKNIRYAIHSDGAANGLSTDNTQIYLKNVALIHNGFDEGKTPSYKVPCAWGGGTGSNIIRRFENCIFKAVEYTPWGSHDRQSNTAGGQIDFINCDFISYQSDNNFDIAYSTGSLNLISYGSHKKISVNLVNCRLNNHILLYVEDTSVVDREVDYYVRSDNEVFVVTSTTNDSNRHKNYTTGFCKDVYFSDAATMGSPIVLSGINRGAVAGSSAPASLIYGILLHDVSAGEMGTVLYYGRFAQNRILGTTFASGTKVGWDGSAWVEDNDNPIFIALTSAIAKLI